MVHDAVFRNKKTRQFIVVMCVSLNAHSRGKCVTYSMDGILATMTEEAFLEQYEPSTETAMLDALPYDKPPLPVNNLKGGYSFRDTYSYRSGKYPNYEDCVTNAKKYAAKRHRDVYVYLGVEILTVLTPNGEIIECKCLASN